MLTGDDAGHGELRRVRGWLQETAARRWVVDLAGGGAWFAGDEVRGGEASGGGSSGRFRLQMRGETEGK